MNLKRSFSPFSYPPPNKPPFRGMSLMEVVVTLFAISLLFGILIVFFTQGLTIFNLVDQESKTIRESGRVLSLLRYEAFYTQKTDLQVNGSILQVAPDFNGDGTPDYLSSYSFNIPGAQLELNRSSVGYIPVLNNLSSFTLKNSGSPTFPLIELGFSLDNGDTLYKIRTSLTSGEF